MVIFLKVIFCAVNARYTHSSLALRYLKAYNSQFNIKIREFSVNDSIMDIYASLYGEGADFYCFSCYIWNIEHTVKIAELIKSALPESKIVLGGPEVSYNPESYSLADFIICGEGEEAMGEILSGQAKERIIYTTPFDLSKMPLPYCEDEIKGLKNKIIYFETSRGCPCKCTYCLSGDDTSVRYFPMEYVKQGFDLFFRMNVPLVKLIDRTFNANPKRAKEIIDYIINNSRNTRVHFEIEPHFLTEEIVTILQNAPKDLFQLEIGVQTSNPETLNAVNRSTDIVKMAENIKRLREKNNMHIHLDLIAGLPYEDYESFKKSFEYVYALKPDMLQLGFLKVLHGTKMESTNEIKYSPFPPYFVISTPWLSAEEIISLNKTENAVDRYYNSGAFKRTMEKIGCFDTFEKLGVLSDREGGISRRDLYNILYDGYGEIAGEEILFDFLENNRDMPLPDFAKHDKIPDFKKLINKYISDNEIKTEQKHLRFEAIKGRIILTDYAKKTVTDITEHFFSL